MKQLLRMFISTCLLFTAFNASVQAQGASCSTTTPTSSASCSAVSYSTSDYQYTNHWWQITCPTGNFSYYLDATPYSGGGAYVIIWGDIPNAISTSSGVNSGSISGVNSQIVIDTEIWAQNGSASLNISGW